MADNDIQLATPSHGTVEYDTMTPGTFFCGWKPYENPLLRIEGGYVSLVNGAAELDAKTAYFVGKKVWPVQPGSKITINVSE